MLEPARDAGGRPRGGEPGRPGHCSRGQHARSRCPAGNRRRGENGRQAVPRPVLSRPVRRLVDPARTVGAAQGQPGRVGGSPPGLPAQSAGLAYNVSKATVTGSTSIVTVSLSGAAAAIGSASEAPHLHGGPVRIRPVPPQLLRPRQHQGGHRRGEGRRILRPELSSQPVRHKNDAPPGRGPGGASHAGMRTPSVTRPAGRRPGRSSQS